jgi:hypothetical protein
VNGSLTILIDGTDPFDGHDGRHCLSCRIYRDGSRAFPSVRPLG